jgi:thiol-disulfide isomerase/thioredoxin
LPGYNPKPKIRKEIIKLLFLMKSFIYILSFLLLTSCAYRNLEGNVKPVYFSTDPVVFTDTLVAIQRVLYQNVMRLSYPCLEMVDLREGEMGKAFISKPTFFRKDDKEFLVYPGESIFITANDSNNYEPAFSTVSKNKVRDRELLLLKTFQELEKRPEVPRLFPYTLDTILHLEKVLKTEIGPSERASQFLFDSLSNVYQVSQKFKTLTKDYIHNRYDATLLILYATYRDTLLAYHLYESKVRALLPAVNDLTKTGQFNLNVEQNTNALYTCLFPDRGIRNMVAAVGGFQASFDSVVANFNGLARDYLLSRIMFRAYRQGSGIPPGYEKRYYRYSMNKDHRKIITRAARQTRHSQGDTHALPNQLLMTDGKTELGLDDVLSQHKGKYVLLDLWASWCVPCIDEMPALQALSKKYPADKIAFLNISVDKSVQDWHTRLHQLHSDSLTSYLLLNAGSASLVKQIGLSTIPRFLLYDKAGRIINADAPPPSDPELAEILDKYLLK